MSDEESLSPASRLNSDSATSPVCAASATAAPIVTSCRLPSCMATRSSTSGPYNSAAASAPTVPPIAPAHVFLGDSTGASLGPPSSVPAAMAQVSHTHVRTRGITTSAVEPRGCASLWSPCRVVQLAGAEHAEAGEKRRQHPAAQPQHDHRSGDGRDGEGDSHEQVARHYTVTLPKRRSRRW